MNKIIKRKNRTKITKENKQKIKLEKETMSFLGLATVVHVHISPKPIPKIYTLRTSQALSTTASKTTAEDGPRVLKYKFDYFFSLKNRLLLTSHPCERDDCISGNNLSYERDRETCPIG